MEYRRVKGQATENIRQKSIDCLAVDNQHYLQNARNKFRKSKNRNYTNSLHSIDAKRSSLNLQQRVKLTQRKKLLSIPISSSKTLITQRPQNHELTQKKNSHNRFIPIQLRHRSERHIIDETNLQHKQKKIKDCISLMQGVLNEIQQEKSHRKVAKPKIIDEFTDDKTVVAEKAVFRQDMQSKFEDYVKNITKIKNDSKLLIIKRGKSKSNLNEHIISSYAIKADKFESIANDKIKQKTPNTRLIIKPNNKNRRISIDDQSEKQNNINLEDIECSSIDKANQSSFISQYGKKSLRRHLEEQNKNTLNKVSVVKNSKQLRSLFPNDFF